MSLDLFRFTPNPSSVTTFIGGEAIEGYLSAMWVERYQNIGEFQIKAKMSSGLMDYLPLDTFISRPCTFEVMVVENHEIVDDKDIDPTLIITGRSLPSILDRRILDAGFKSGTNYGQWNLGTMGLSSQIAWIINWHTLNTPVPDDRIDNIIGTTSITGEPNSQNSSIPIEDVLTAVLKLVVVDDLGIRCLRRSPFFITGGSATTTNINIYKGVDKSATVIFSHEQGDINEAHYLWTNKNYKNSAMMLGQKVVTFKEDATITKINRRMILVDASDIENAYGYSLGMQDILDIKWNMEQRGTQALKNQRKIVMTQADVSAFTKYNYRKDYGMGDLVMLDGNFGIMQKMRVIEHVEIEDENGASAHPTLALPPS